MRFFPITKRERKPEFSKLILYYFSMAEKRLKGLKWFLNISTEKIMVNLIAETVEFFALEQNLYHV